MKKIAVVTGSRRGIGLATAKKIASEGYTAILSDVVEREEVAELLDELGEGFDYMKCRIHEPEDRKALVTAVLEKYGRLDIHVNNAGVAPKVRNDILEMTEESYDFVLDINLKGTFFLTQLIANTMISLKEKGLEDYSPRIVNIGSISAYTSSTSRGEYCMSKAGVTMVTNLFADRLAKEDIPVFEVRPGIILTDMTKTVEESYQQKIKAGLTPVQRMGKPEDVANCVWAACSGLLDFAAGQILNADGGFHLRRL